MKQKRSAVVLAAVLAISGCTKQTSSSELNEVGEPALNNYETTDEDVKNVMMDFRDVPDEMTEEADQSGSLQYFYYTTQNYNEGDTTEMQKYAVVYTPYGYDPSLKYDILYLMHGYTGDATVWLGSPDEPGEVKYMLDNLIEKQKIHPLIVVAPTYYDNNEDEETDNIDVDLVEPFGLELKNDLIPAVESSFSTYAEDTSDDGLAASGTHRAFGGFSMGGVTTLYRLIHEMDRFSCFVDFSGPIYWSNLVNSETGDWGGTYLKEQIEEQRFNDSDFYLYLATGSQDEAYPLMDQMVASMLKQSDMFHFGKPDETCVNVTYGVCSGEIHDWHNRLRCLYNILPMLSGHMNGDEFDKGRKEHYQKHKEE